MPYHHTDTATGPKITIRGPVGSCTSYGLHLQAVALDLIDFGFDVHISNARHNIDQTYGSVDQRVLDRLLPDKQHVPLDSKCELLIAPMDALPVHPRTVYNTMHESDFLSPGHKDILRRAAMIVVPCSWNLDTYQQAFPEKPVHKIPLGIKTDIFRPKPFPEGKFVFGTAGRFVAAGGRKNPERVIDAFLKAFPNDDDVELHVKCYPDCPIAEPEDPRIVMTRDFMSESDVANWLYGIHCYVNVSAGEAFGLWLLQAMACGRVVISHNFGGPAEFLNSGCYMPLSFQTVEAQGPYYFGHQAEVGTPELIWTMQTARSLPRSGLSRYGLNATQNAQRFSWRISNLKLVNLLVTEGYLQWP